MKIIELTQGNYVVNKEKNFSLFTHSTNTSELKMAIRPFLIITANDFILLDTGINFLNNGEPLLFESLKKESITPEQITKILISHLHKDHIGGIGHFLGNNFKENFPNAKIYLQQRELNFALTQENNPSYDFKVLKYLKTLPNIVMLNDNEGKISDAIFYQVSGGHTPFHQVFWLKENEETIFFGADNLPKLSYWKLNLAFKNDYDGLTALSLRKKWKKVAKNKNWIVLFYHDIETPFIKVAKTDFS
ncbi:MBL fold metallo-hydrolase [Flavobacterium jejuense]|uniref:MBL fold metallo-hydrolase n=1 Tax=Flavobacterium jejuense TaxID=1544455 RepID=A0ABX0ILB9_9FLAO|nr:MBL fold metallo-hydrolase [Flavobacterium jejuense]NHN24602.1 MBL fold metallo-hydrolase [Flavobacterium jejuense]